MFKTLPVHAMDVLGELAKALRPQRRVRSFWLQPRAPAQRSLTGKDLSAACKPEPRGGSLGPAAIVRMGTGDSDKARNRSFKGPDRRTARKCSSKQGEPVRGCVPSPLGAASCDAHGVPTPGDGRDRQAESGSYHHSGLATAEVS